MLIGSCRFDIFYYYKLNLKVLTSYSYKYHQTLLEEISASVKYAYCRKLCQKMRRLEKNMQIAHNVLYLENFDNLSSSIWLII